MSDLLFSRLPAGQKVISGGTRTRIKTDRPWQVNWKETESSCPFEHKDEEIFRSFDSESGWYLRKNAYTPYPWHFMLLPKTCWPPEKLRTLGGREDMQIAHSILQEVFLDEPDEIWVSAHIGYSAGQNLKHLHYHLLKPQRDEIPAQPVGVIESYFKNPPLELFSNGELSALLGGLRAGQCFFFSTSRDTANVSPRAIADLLSRVIDVYSQKFSNIQGLPPDYTVQAIF